MHAATSYRDPQKTERGYPQTEPQTTKENGSGSIHRWLKPGFDGFFVNFPFWNPQKWLTGVVGEHKSAPKSCPPKWLVGALKSLKNKAKGETEPKKDTKMVMGVWANPTARIPLETWQSFIGHSPLSGWWIRFSPPNSDVHQRLPNEKIIPKQGPCLNCLVAIWCPFKYEPTEGPL